MACFHPIIGYRTPSGTLTQSRSGAYIDRPMTVACGQCIGCRLSRSHAWAIRCVHEASQRPQNHFVTLTYDEANQPPGGTLYHPHFQKFIKRLRKQLEPHRISFFMCGEYGDDLARPHYHALIFGYAFKELSLWKNNSQGDPIFTSPELTRLWGHGIATAQDVNFKTAAYCARYITKKITGKNAEAHYTRTNPDTLETIQLQNEYASMSKKPAIGATWQAKYDSDLYPSDFIIIEGRKCPIPAYYDRLKERVSPEALEKIKLQRIRNAIKHKPNNTPERLAVRKIVLQAKLTKLSRPLEAPPAGGGGVGVV